MSELWIFFFFKEIKTKPEQTGKNAFFARVTHVSKKVRKGKKLAIRYI